MAAVSICYYSIVSTGAASISTSATELLRLARPRQWIKNTFVLAPLVFARAYLDAASIKNALLAFALFCVASSASYIVNDLRDIERDRLHPVKKARRPLAAGTVTPQAALVLLAVLYCVLMAGWLWSPAAMLPIAGYIPDRKAIKYLVAHRDIEVWLVPIAGTRFVVPYRLAIPTPLGLGVLEATRFVATPMPSRASAAVTRP